MNNDFLFAFLLTLFAGLATTIGGIISLFPKKDNKKFLAISLGFSAGVMLYVSFVEIFVKANESLEEVVSKDKAAILTALGFFIGMALIGVVDKIMKNKEKKIKDEANNDSNSKLLRMGIFTAIALAIHNFPEGLVTFVAALEDPSLGVVIAVAIAIHNIPEGIAVAVPVYYATGNKLKALKYSFLSGFAEPVGAVIGYLILSNFINGLTFGIVFASVAGIMVYISLNDLLPQSREYADQKTVTYGMILGMLVMAISLLMIG